ncbi:YgjV family protein [Salinicola lusitanus]|uniref:YgjV family protein n=1 Tax=Salinicola lusitanus TaxID=1949085 RepID=A0ABZ3CUI1_9GAMM|nr:YgjV family protein [Salinicola sp. CR57]
MDAHSPTWIAAQIGGFVALGFIIAAFASRQDDRLLLYLIFANVAFAVHFLLFGEAVAAGMSVLVVVRIWLARRFPRRQPLMWLVLIATGAVAVATWQSWYDIFPLLAAVFGTLAMFLLRGLPMRVLLAGVALCWLANALIIGSIGGFIAELLALGTNLVTMWRIHRAKRRCESG